MTVGLCLDPLDPASASIVQKARRSLKPTAARDRRDARHRLDRGRRVLAEALQGDQIPDYGVFPGLGDRWDVPSERTAILIPKESFERITEKIVRGITYFEHGVLIEPPYEIDFFALPEDGLAPWNDALDKWGVIYAREPAVVVRRAGSHDDRMCGLFEITFWKQFKTYASVTHESTA